MENPPPSRIANKSLIPPTRDPQTPPTDRLPRTTPPTGRPRPAAGAQAPAGGAEDNWSGRTEEFLNAAPETPQATALPMELTPDLSIDFRHSGWMPARRRVDAALRATPGVSPRRVAAFCSCGSNATVEMSEPKQTCNPAAEAQLKRAIKNAHPAFRIRSIKCHDRFCVPCSNERSRRVRHAILDYIHGMPDLSLITLTLLASEDTLTACLDRITKAFKALRQKALWKKAVKGGISIIETKVGEGSGRWHCHYHILCQAGYLDQKKLSALWLEVTGDSYIVDIRRVGARTGAVQYITKYITKSSDQNIVNSPRHLSEAIIGFTGRRLVSTFGTFRGLQLMENVDEYKHEEDGPTQWRTVGLLEDIISKAAEGDPSATRILRILRPPKHADPPGV